MAIGVYLTYRILDVADLTGGQLLRHRRRGLRHGPAVRAERLDRPDPGLYRGAGLRPLSPDCCTPSWASRAILAGILTPAGPLFGQPEDHGQVQPVHQRGQVRPADLPALVKEFALRNPVVMVILITLVLIGILYWFFGHRAGLLHPRPPAPTPHMSRALRASTPVSTWCWA